MKNWLRSKDEINEFPYTGRIIRVTEGEGMGDDTKTVIYEGAMDEHMVTKEEGDTMQTASYIVSIPLTKDENDKYIIPFKGDIVVVDVYGVSITMIVDNSDPSQLGGVSIHATRDEQLTDVVDSDESESESESTNTNVDNDDDTDLMG